MLFQQIIRKQVVLRIINTVLNIVLWAAIWNLGLIFIEYLERTYDIGAILTNVVVAGLMLMLIFLINDGFVYIDIL
jgi:hypothetical protein